MVTGDEKGIKHMPTGKTFHQRNTNVGETLCPLLEETTDRRSNAELRHVRRTHSIPTEINGGSTEE